MKERTGRSGGWLRIRTKMLFVHKLDGALEIDRNESERESCAYGNLRKSSIGVSKCV